MKKLIGMAMVLVMILTPITTKNIKGANTQFDKDRVITPDKKIALQSDKDRETTLNGKKVINFVEKTAIPSVEEIMSMESFDGRDYRIVTPVKDQGSTNLCWAYSSIAAMETSILRSGIDANVTKDTLSLNPTAAAYRVYKRESDPLENTSGEWQSVNYLQQSGDPLKIVKLSSMWWAPVKGNQAAVNPYENPTYRFENAFHIRENKENPKEYISNIKKAIATYGAVTFQYNNLRETTYYNPKNEPGSNSSPHACTIIGWDDNIPAENFVPNGAAQKGGWLVKNSYNSLEYFWLSYDNTSSCSYAFSFALRDKYDYNYYYDGNIEDFSLRNDKAVANVFKAKKSGIEEKDEYIKAVNVGISGENVTVQVEIYKNLDYPFGGQSNVPISGGNLSATATKTFENGGYVTVELERTVKIEKDEWFSAIVRVSNKQGDAKIITSYKNDMEMSYVNTGSGWSKLKNYVGRVKVYTKLEKETDVEQTEATTEPKTTEKPVETTTKKIIETTTEKLVDSTTKKAAETTKSPETTYVENGNESTTKNNLNKETTSKKISAIVSNTTQKVSTTKKIKKAKIIKTKKIKKRDVRIYYKKLKNAKKYEIQYSTNKNFKKNIKIIKTKKLYCKISKLKKNKKYYIRVRGRNNNIEGGWSKVLKIKLK